MPELDRPANLSPKQEWLGAGLIIFVFLSISLLVATRTPTVYIDEPVFADPAANLYFGQGFTSTMWAQDRHELFSRQPPLYMRLLYVFFECFGFGLRQARMANAVMAAAAALLVWGALRRTGFIQSPAYRLTALVLILSGSVSTLTFRMVRYDVAMFLVSALVFNAWCLPANCRSRYLWVILASALCPFAGVPMLPYVSLLLAIQFVVYRFRNLGLMISVATGFALGVGLFLLYYYHYGVLGEFLDFVSDVTGARHRQAPPLSVMLFGDDRGNAGLLTSFFGYPNSFQNMKTLFDYSAFLLFAVFALLAWKIWPIVNGPNRKFIVFIVLTTLGLPPIIHVAGHYWSDYRWMTYIPLTIAVPWLLEWSRELAVAPRLRRWLWGIVGLSIFFGVPLRSLVTVPDWSARSTKPLEQVAARVVQPSDIVLCQCKTYFAIRPRAQLVFCSGLSAMGELQFIKDFPTNQISLICLYPTNIADITAIVGGKWKKLALDDVPEAAALSRTRYAVNFYRRDTNGAPPSPRP
jgi:hypothetical protein